MPSRTALPRRPERDAGRLPPWLPGIAPKADPARLDQECPLMQETVSPLCSAKGCRAGAVWVLAWNNPKLHVPERRKTWAACDTHRESLSEFLQTRGFLRESLTVEQWAESAADR